MPEAMIGRNRRGGFKRRAPAVSSELEPTYITTIPNLWAWAWTGVGGNRCTLIDGGSGRFRITQIDDISGNGNHYVRVDPVTTEGLPFFEETLSVNDTDVDLKDGFGTYTTPYAPIFRHKLNDGSDIGGQYLKQNTTFNAAGEFYLAAAILNTRDSGTRYVWGRNGQHSIRIAQDTDRVLANINTAILDDRVIIGTTGSVPIGLLIFEMIRDGSNLVTAKGNGATIGTSTISGLFDFDGIGGTGAAGWDDGGFEFLSFNGAVSAGDQTYVRNYLSTKWASTT